MALRFMPPMEGGLTERSAYADIAQQTQGQPDHDFITRLQITVPGRIDEQEYTARHNALAELTGSRAESEQVKLFDIRAGELFFQQVHKIPFVMRTYDTSSAAAEADAMHYVAGFTNFVGLANERDTIYDKYHLVGIADAACTMSDNKNGCAIITEGATNFRYIGAEAICPNDPLMWVHPFDPDYPTSIDVGSAKNPQQAGTLIKATRKRLRFDAHSMFATMKRNETCDLAAKLTQPELDQQVQHVSMGGVDVAKPLTMEMMQAIDEFRYMIAAYELVGKVVAAQANQPNQAPSIDVLSKQPDFYVKLATAMSESKSFAQLFDHVYRDRFYGIARVTSRIVAHAGGHALTGNKLSITMRHFNIASEVGQFV